MPEEIPPLRFPAGYGAGIVAPSSVELSPHLDLWMRGARTGVVLNVEDRVARVAMDHPQVRRPVRIPIDGLKRIF